MDRDDYESGFASFAVDLTTLGPQDRPSLPVNWVFASRASMANP